MPIKNVVLVGANVAGVRAADALRQAGFDGRLVLVGAEPDLPYERPPLSKEYLQSDLAEERFTIHPAAYYDQHAIDLRLGRRAVSLDPHSATVALDSGERLHYDRLLIATGATPRRLDNLPGADLPGIVYLRDLADARQLRTEMASAQRVVIVGTGFIGAEVAASSRRTGLEVVALEAAPVPLGRALGDVVGQLYADIHRGRGVDLRTNATVTGFRGQRRVEQVLTGNDEAIDCDLVVVGVGVAPAVDWLADSGIALDNGVVVDELCRTSVPGVYAAGDVANWWHPTNQERLRVEHYDNAQFQGVAAARSMLGIGEPYAPVPYFWSDQYELNLQYVGHASGSDEVVLRGAVDSGAWTAFYCRDGRLRAALTVNRRRDLTPARKLIAARAQVSARQLADESCDLKTLLPPAAVGTTAAATAH
jgi:3-phenylpropionate/trans-cinnamate dioxygenase ferredoxin reductase component